jgi:hypothetical protein
MSLAQSGRAGHKGLASNEQQPYPVGTSVDHLTGEREQRDQRIETEPLGSLEIRGQNSLIFGKAI